MPPTTPGRWRTASRKAPGKAMTESSQRSDRSGHADPSGTTAWLFPGQGAQHRGMGRDLLARHPAKVSQATEILGWPVAELCAAGSDEALRRTENAQPAIFIVSALAAMEQRERQGLPHFVAGHSLGEYSALFAAGCLDFATGVRLVRRRGELMAGAPPGR